MNVVYVQGTLSSTPKRRQLPSGAELVTWEVTTEMDGQRYSVPVVWFDPPRSLPAVDRGEAVAVAGVVRRRFFSAGGRTASRTEVVASMGAPLRRRKRVERIQQHVWELVDGLSDATGDATAA